MSTTFSCLSRTVLATAVCVASAAAFAKHAQRPQMPPETISSVLLSDDERIEFCTQMHRASTLDERRAVAERLRDTLMPRAKARGIALPSWLLDGSAMKRFGSPSDSISGLACESGAAKPRGQTTPPVHEAPDQKLPSRETVDQKKMPANDVSRSDMPVGHDRGIAYVTGGVGQDEAAALRGLASGYNMRATFTSGTGEYLSGVAVQVSRPDGMVVFEARSEGPYLFAQLPPGRYRVVATFDGVGRTRQINVPSHGSTRFTLVWPASWAPAR
jgi:hypothetical protein